MTSLQDNGTERVAICGRVRELVSEVVDLLEEIIEAEVDSLGHSNPVPGGSVGDLIAELACQLQLLFTTERDERQRMMTYSNAQRCFDAITSLDTEHDALLAQINRVYELTGTPLRPASTWTDIESNFRRFVVQLNDHIARTDRTLR